MIEHVDKVKLRGNDQHAQGLILTSYVYFLKPLSVTLIAY